MSKSVELLLGAVVVIFLLGWLIASFDRHLRWDVRRFRWHMRILFHCVAFVAIIAIAAFAYTKVKGGGSSKPPTITSSSSTTPATTTPAATTPTTPAKTTSTTAKTTTSNVVTTTTTTTINETGNSPAKLAGSAHVLHVSSIRVDGSKKNTWLVFTHARGQHFDVNARVLRSIHVGGNYTCRVSGITLLSCTK